MTQPESVATEVTVAGIVAGDPPLLAWQKRLHRSDGKQKVHVQWTPVLDQALLERLQRQVCEGDQIEIVVVTDWSRAGAPTYLAGFSVGAMTARTTG